jgi:ATP-dependent Clp protease ATP-binding subunit ClpC
MFERFTERARQVVVLAQEEARRIDHNYIGTEHVLLGLLREGHGIGARALEAAGIALDQVRADVEAEVGRGKGKPKGHIPFTPRAKKVLELALREALQLRHDYIGTEHILLGLTREGEGLGARILRRHDVDFMTLRLKVLDLAPAGESLETRRLRRWLRPRGSAASAAEEAEALRTTTATDVSLDEARRLAGDAAVGSHHLLLATLNDPSSAAAKALTSLGIDLDQARDALRNVDITGTTDELPEEAGRRQLRMTVSGDGLTLETTDPTLLADARAALEAIAALPGGGTPDVTEVPASITGEHPLATGFAGVWRAWHLALRHIIESAHQAEPPAA